MKLARYMGGGQIAILEEDPPTCPEGGLLVRTEASGLCSGELMDWYMDRKIPHVLGHEVAGIVVESQDSRFPVGCRVAPHHHAPCMKCELCMRGAYVHCEQWKRTKLVPGGMAEFFAVGAENLTDTHVVSPSLSERSGDGEGAGGRGELRAVDAALMEPLGCVMKSVRLSHVFDQLAIDSAPNEPEQRIAVVGVGFMGLLHMLRLRGRYYTVQRLGEAPRIVEAAPQNLVAYELNESRAKLAREIGLDVRHPSEAEPADVVFLCPGTLDALALALKTAAPGATIVIFSPFGETMGPALDLDALYFADQAIVSTYSAGPNDCADALRFLRHERIKAEQVVSHFISIDELPAAYQAMKRGEILKPMVVFD